MRSRKSSAAGPGRTLPLLAHAPLPTSRPGRWTIRKSRLRAPSSRSRATTSAPRGGLKWWVLQDRGDPGPYAVMSLDEQGIVRRFVPGEGLVHWPSLAMYVVQGEPGARPVSEDEALQLIDQGLGAIDDGYVIL